MNPEGQIHYIDWSVGGVADGSDISLNLKPTSLLLGVVNVSGSLSGNKLTLTGGISGTSSDSYVLYRSSLDQYRTALAALKRQSAATIKQRREAAVKAVIAATAEAMREKVQRDQEAFAADVHKLCDGMDKFTVAGRAMIQTIPEIAARYRAITAKMRNYLQRGRGLSNTSYAKGQVSYALNDGLFAADRVHFKAQSLQDSFSNDVEPQMRAADRALGICSRPSMPVPIVDPACKRLKDLYPSYSEVYRNVAQGLADIERTYQAELKKQRALKAEADQLN